jgi:tetratricopeptide (TPR) repeat protein
MKKFFIAVFCVLTISSYAQVELPYISPSASVSQTIGYTNIIINYCRPAVKDRKIWDALVPFNQVWRTGANEATTIQFTRDVTVEGKKIPAGRYSLFTIPAEDKWTVIFNKEDKQWGAFNYKPENDLVRFEVKPRKGEFFERLQFSFKDVTDVSAVVVLNWEKLEVPFKVESDVYAQALAKIKKAIAADPDRWQNYTEGAMYAADNNVFLDEALLWADKAISVAHDYFPYFVKAKVLLAQNKYREALNVLNKCRDTGHSDKNWDTFVSQVDFLEKQIKTLMK